MTKRYNINDYNKKHRVLQQPTSVSDILSDGLDDEFENSIQDERSRRMSVRQWRRFKQETF